MADRYVSPEQRRYSRVAIALHWLIALAIAYNLASGLLHGVVPHGFFVLHVSSGITILVLTLVRIVWRLTHRPPPFLPMTRWEAGLAHGVHFLLYAAMLALPLSGWALVSANPPAGSPGAAYAQQQKAAGAGMPERLPGGSVRQGSGGPAGEGRGGGQPPRRRGPTMLYGLVRLPLIAPLTEIGRQPEGVARQHALHERIETLHLIGGWTMLALLVLHVAGALKHQFADREPELARMGIGRLRRAPIG